MRLETAQGEFVADAEPVIPHNGTLPDDVVIWDQRLFVKAGDDVWRETLPLVVQ